LDHLIDDLFLKVLALMHLLSFFIKAVKVVTDHGKDIQDFNVKYKSRIIGSPS
jgi:hypothetical protein